MPSILIDNIEQIYQTQKSKIHTLKRSVPSVAIESAESTNAENLLAMSVLRQLYGVLRGQRKTIYLVYSLARRVEAPRRSRPALSI